MNHFVPENWRPVASKSGVLASDLGRVLLPPSYAPMHHGGFRLYEPIPTAGSEKRATKGATHVYLGIYTSRPIEAAHVRIGSGAGVGQKPSDWRAVSLCKEHHSRQHEVGERTFWSGIDVERLIDEFCRQSPRAPQIREVRREVEYVR